jgi:VWFA-related protein
MSLNARLGDLLLLFMVCAAAASAQQSSLPNPPDTGRIYLDVVVTPKSGPPVTGLQQQDFTVLDNKSPQTITSFRAFRGREAPIEIVLVIDDVNAGIVNIGYQRSEIDKFLRTDGGHLSFPTALAFLTDSGIKLQNDFTSDGNALSTALDQYVLGLHTILRSGGFYSAAERFQVSFDALQQLATHEAARPGRKLILWISPGWPLLSGPGVEEDLDAKQRQSIFNSVVSVSTLLRQANVTLYSIDPLGAGESESQAFYWQTFLKGVSKPTQAHVGDLALQVIATQSGGLALTASNDISGNLQKCLADTQAYYELSFSPALDQKPDQYQYHQLEVRVAKAGLVARTRQGYYSQP